MKLKYNNNQWEAGEVPDKPVKGYYDNLDPYDQYAYSNAIEKYHEDLELAMSQFKPIAPNDQEKVNDFIMEIETDNPEGLVNLNWQPEIGKLYDSGDLEFELKEETKYSPTAGKYLSTGNKFWTLIEKIKEEPRQDHLEYIHQSNAKILEQQLEIKQLQSRIDELEEQRERLIAKLMNAEDKIKESN